MVDTSKLTPLLLLDDEPIRSGEHDKLNQRRYAELIAEAALGTTGPFTIGVYGGWGQGKTSLLKHAKDLLDQRSNDTQKMRLFPQVVTVFFNAWRYEREAHPIVPLVATIAQAVQRRLDEDATLSQQTDKTLRRWWGMIVDASKAAVGSTKVDVGASLGNPIAGQAQAKVTVDAGAMQRNYMENRAERNAADALATDPWIKQSLYLSAFDDLESLWNEEVIKVASPSNPAPRIVVFVDDLDRCQPEKAFELLEGIKLALAQPGFIFVLALNADIINRYLAIEAVRRYGSDHSTLGERYLDKIVQLEVQLRSHKREFPGFIEATVMKSLGAALGTATGKPPKDFADAVLSLNELIGRFTDHTPRTLIRRLNSLIVDERLLPEDAPFEARKPGERSEDHKARRRGYYMGLLLVQRTLVEMPGVGVAAVRALHEQDGLCRDLHDHGLDELYDALKPRDRLEITSPEADPPTHQSELIRVQKEKQASRWLKVLMPFRGREAASELWQTQPGKAWLKDHAARRAVVELVVDRPASDNSVGSKGGGAGRGAHEGSDPGSTPMSDALIREITIIKHAARQHLGLKADAPLGPAEFARVTKLSLSWDQITDAGAIWLARADTGLSALTSLDLSVTDVTDAGLQALARANTGPAALTSLDLSGTKVTDGGVQELARSNTGLAALTSLDLSGTYVTDEGIRALARVDTGLAALTTLYLGGTQVTDKGVAAIKARFPGITIHR